MNICVSGFLALAVAVCACAQTGEIIPSDKDAPDPAELSVDSLDAHVVIDNGHATVRLQEVFHNKTAKVLEGTYRVALPDNAAVSDFAVWDDLTRIPGVILERKRAGELYDQIRAQTLDPGLLESGEVGESNAPGAARRSTEFTVKIAPIPPYGYKRVEAEYRQEVPIRQLASDFVLPLKTSAAVGRLSLSVDLRSAQAISHVESAASAYPLQFSTQTGNAIAGTFQGSGITLAADFEIRYNIADDPSPRLVATRSGEAHDPGYFEASSILATPASPGTASAPEARRILILFDTSLSMQWEKLERSFQALESTLRSLKAADSFNVLVFNSETLPAFEQPQSATVETVAKALDFVRASKLRGGTNLEQACTTAFAQSSENTYVVLLSDGEATEGTLSQNKLALSIDSQWRSIRAERRPHVYVLAIGDDANVRLMRRLASHSGVFEQVNSTEAIDFKLASFVHEIGLAPLEPVGFTISPNAGASFIYRLGSDNFPGSLASWVGQYANPGRAQIAIRAGPGSRTATVQLPKVAADHPYLPAAWARARVDALLEKIDREGEDKASIDEIIRLSRKYHFVTPYTSFLAAPRALLRPRLIRPGDPMLRVHTDPSIVSVIALFPFDLNQPLTYLRKEDVWQTRFVAPDDLADGTYTVRLILRDKDNRVYREQKTFVISSHPPVVRVQLASARVHPGERLKLRVEASQTTRTITARLYGAEPLSLRWSEADKSNTGTLLIPSALPAGRYSIHVAAEDIAHNISHQEVPLEVLP